MTRAGLTEKLLDIKREKGWSWKYICEQIGGMSPILVTGAILGQHKLTKPQAANAAKLFGLSKNEQALLNEVPMRGTSTPMPPTDPLLYLRVDPGQRPRDEGADRGRIRGRDNVRDRLRHGYHAQDRPKGRPCCHRHERQIPTVQILRGDRQRASLWIKGGVSQ